MPKAGFRGRRKNKKIVISYVTNSCYLYNNKLKHTNLNPYIQHSSAAVFQCCVPASSSTVTLRPPSLLCACTCWRFLFEKVQLCRFAMRSAREAIPQEPWCHLCEVHLEDGDNIPNHTITLKIYNPNLKTLAGP